MSRIRFAFASLFAGLSISSVALADDHDDYHSELLALSLGSFTSIEQSARDNRYAVVESEIVRIWPDREDGYWFYQEQALLGQTPDNVDRSIKDKPYLVRVIHSVEVEPGVFRRTPHKLKNPAATLGAWRTEAPLSNVSLDDLVPVACSLTLKRVAENYWISQSEPCPNAYKGASYALSLGVKHEGGYANWDRGFTEAGEHVWGPATGGYIFKAKQ